MLGEIPGNIDGNIDGHSMEKELNERIEDSEPAIKLDKHGFPLIPQPSSNANDPLNWPRRKKFWVLFLMSLDSFCATFTSSVMSPTFAQVAVELSKTPSQVSYANTVLFLGAAVSCFLWSPLANVYGRRPILVYAQTLAVIADFGCSFSKTFSALIAGRFFAGFGHGAGTVVTYLAIGDIFFLHERGKMLGIVTVALVAGPHVAPLPGGFVATYISWRWTLILPAIFAAVVLVLLFTTFPETLYHRDEDTEMQNKKSSFWSERRLWGFKAANQSLRVKDVLTPFHMLGNFLVVAICFYSGVAFVLGSLLPTLTASAIFRTFYGFNSAQTGIILSVCTTVGGGLGEFAAGPVTDLLMFRARQRSEGKVNPEARLHALWFPSFLLPAGALIYGLMIHFHDRINISWLPASFALAVTCFAVQIITTTNIAYIVDCYKPQAAHTLQLINFTRLGIGFTVGFWALPFANKVGYQFAGLTYALVYLLFFLPILVLMRYGERIRIKLGEPSF